jgi:hypothetical protein
MTGIDGGGEDLVWPPRDLTSRLGVSPAKIIMSRPMWWMTSFIEGGQWL